jgi:hypothetical protein
MEARDGRPEVARAEAAAEWELIEARESASAGQGALRAIVRLRGRWRIPRHLWGWCRIGLGANLGECGDHGAPNCL